MAFLPLVPPRRITVSHTPGRRIDPHLFTTLGITQLDKPRPRQLGFTLIIYLYGYDIVLAVGDGHGIGKIFGRNEIGDEKYRTPFLYGVGKITQRLRKLGSRMFGCKVDQFAYDNKDVFFSFCGG